MKRLQNWLPIVAVAAVVTFGMAGAPKFVCGLTGKESAECCCEPKDGKLLCKETGQFLEACCCETK